MSVGLKDVARLAGVSMATVSRVIGAPHLVHHETRTRVQRAIDALQYRPSRATRRLRRDSARANLLGLIVPDLQNPFFADLVRGAEQVARRNGYMLFLGTSDEEPEKERAYLDLMRSESVHGLILPTSSQAEAVVTDLVRHRVPVVCVDRRLPSADVDTVVADNVHGAYDATAHLVRLGHRRIAFVQGRPQLSTSQERLRGYRQALEAHGLAYDAALVREGDSRQQGGRRLTHELLTSPHPPSALLVGNNLMTLGALEVVRALGLRIPDDVAIVGYDDVPWALACDPPLTVVRQPAFELGQCAAEVLVRRIADPRRRTSVVTLQPELVVRRSCGAGRVAAVAAPSVAVPGVLPLPVRDPGRALTG